MRQFLPSAQGFWGYIQGMQQFYSQRNAPAPTRLRYDFPPEARSRVLAVIDHSIPNSQLLDRFLAELHTLLLRQYGVLAEAAYRVVRRSDIPVVEHFHLCSDIQAIDFVEAIFRLDVQCGGQDSVNEINTIFRQSAMGYELTRFVGPRTARGGVIIGRRQPIEYPRVIRIDHMRSHVEIVQPAIALLENPKLKIANDEILKAFTDHRLERYADSITSCVSGFESTLKTICRHKGWSFDADRDTCSGLVDICERNGLFPSFYTDLLKRVGTIRNKLGDAHGRGPEALHDVTELNSSHLLNLTCSHIVFLCRLAELE